MRLFRLLWKDREVCTRLSATRGNRGKQHKEYIWNGVSSLWQKLEIMRTSECPWRSSEIDHPEAGLKDAKWLHKATYYGLTTTTYPEILNVVHHLRWLPLSPCDLSNQSTEQYLMARDEYWNSRSRLLRCAKRFLVLLTSSAVWTTLSHWSVSELLEEAIESQRGWTFEEFKSSKSRNNGAVGVSGWKDK